MDIVLLILSITIGTFLGNLLFKFWEAPITKSESFRTAQRIAGIRSDVTITSPSKILKEKQFLNSLAKEEDEL